LDATKFKFLLPFARARDKTLHQSGNVFQPVAQAALSENPLIGKKDRCGIFPVRRQSAIRDW
jgi:hypothetical protein